MAVANNRTRAWFCALLILALGDVSVAARPRLPREAPVPAANPKQPTAQETAKPTIAPPTAPVPEPNPERATVPENDAKQPRPQELGAADIPPPSAPVPEPRPQIAAPQGKQLEQPPAAAPSVTVIIPPHPARSAKDDAECLDALRGLGVTFTTEPPISDPLGCAVANPVIAKDLGKIDMNPEAVFDCPMALAAARFMNDVAAPEVRRDLGSDLVAIDQASAYVCRPRHGTEKLSEHAFGNALDIATFELADGRKIGVRGEAAGAEATFLNAVRNAACGRFTTVLGPGSDADHALHFHVDLAMRRPGSTFCQ